MHEAFIAGVHALIYFVDNAEGAFCKGLEGHEVEDRADCTFAAGLAMGIEGRQGLVFSV